MVCIDKGKSVLCQDLLRIKSWPRTFLCYPQLNGIVAKFGFVVTLFFFLQVDKDKLTKRSIKEAFLLM